MNSSLHFTVGVLLSKLCMSLNENKEQRKLFIGILRNLLCKQKSINLVHSQTIISLSQLIGNMKLSTSIEVLDCLAILNNLATNDKTFQNSRFSFESIENIRIALFENLNLIRIDLDIFDTTINKSYLQTHRSIFNVY